MSEERAATLARRFRSINPHLESDSKAMGEYRLTSYELFWRDHYLWLQEKGYRLRPRYHPDWVASWKGTEKSWAIPQGINILLDATRISDGKQVIFKKVPTVDSEEAFFGRLFSTEPNASLASNHCVPVYDVLEVPDAKNTTLIVMPYLIPWNRLPFETVGEAVECFRQIFDGLQLMHSTQTAHNDIKTNNIMMDHSPLYEDTIHPAHYIMKLDWSGEAREPYSRTLRPVKFYLIDFGHTRCYKDAADRPPRKAVGYGGDRSVPEFSTQDDCDPFAVDVYRLGNVIRQKFTHGDKFSSKKRGFEFMEPLLYDMCQDDPTQRPRMEEVVSRFAEIVKSLSSWKLRSRIADVGETRKDRLLIFPAHWVQQISRIVKRIPAIPKA